MPLAGDNMPSFKYKVTTFLNVDLDLLSRSDLQPLVTVLGDKTYALHVGRDKQTYRAHLELSKTPQDPDAAIRNFAALIRTLPKAERKLWDTAKVRDFNIGVQAAMQPHCYEIPLARETIKAVSVLKARLVFTIYAPNTHEDSSSRQTKRSRAPKKRTISKSVNKKHSQ
jgi:hypothetical protein